MGLDNIQKAQALNALSPFSFHLTIADDGYWVASVDNVEIKSGDILKGLVSNTSTEDPEESVDDLWETATELGDLDYLVINAMKPTRRAVRWNGFMWADIPEEPISSE